MTRTWWLHNSTRFDDEGDCYCCYGVGYHNRFPGTPYVVVSKWRGEDI